jgi:hypothetical protein
MSNATISTPDMTEHVRQAANRTVRRASPFIEKFARIGYASRGMVYTLIGLLSLMAALGQRPNAVGGSRSVMQQLFHHQFGQVLLVALAVGLACHACWQLLLAIYDPEHFDAGRRAVMRRLTYFFSFLIHAALVVFAIRLMLGYAHRADDDATARGWSATIMSYPAGKWGVAAVGLGFVISGLFRIRKGWKADLDRIDVSRLSPFAQRWICRTCQFGIIARGIVFTLVGIFFALAAYHQRPNEAHGLGGSLDALRNQPYGAWLLAIVAIGLMAYGFYEFVRAAWRRITPPA